MARRRLSADESALWRRVAATVRPLAPQAPMIAPEPFAAPTPNAPRAQHPAPAPKAVRADTKPQAHTLDARWDRQLATGRVAPDMTIDLHGHTLDSAHARLDHALEVAIGRGDRVVLLITGRPPRPESERPHARGRIRAAVGDWIAHSRHARRIAAVRAAHPRHGGAGALYIVLRRRRDASEN